MVKNFTIYDWTNQHFCEKIVLISINERISIMTTKLPASFLPAKFQVLSGSALKLIAITLMLIDHTGLMILYNYPATTATLFSFGGVDYSWYRIFRDIGRAAFPIFCFLLVEGFLHTHNRKKYGLNLFLLLISPGVGKHEVPWNLRDTCK